MLLPLPVWHDNHTTLLAFDSGVIMRTAIALVAVAAAVVAVTHVTHVICILNPKP